MYLNEALFWNIYKKQGPIVEYLQQTMPYCEIDTKTRPYF